MKLNDLSESIYIRLILVFITLIILFVSSLNLYIDQKLPNEKQIREIELQIPLKFFLLIKNS